MTGLAALFTMHARGAQRPIDEGQECCLCGKSTGGLKFLGYDEVLGAQWIHPLCEAAVKRGLAKKRHKDEMDAARNRMWRSL